MPPLFKEGRPVVTAALVWIAYKNLRWNAQFCKRCFICIEICPKQTLVLGNDRIVEEENCIRCGLCERYCPDLAIEVIPDEEMRR